MKLGTQPVAVDDDVETAMLGTISATQDVPVLEARLVPRADGESPTACTQLTHSGLDNVKPHDAKLRALIVQRVGRHPRVNLTRTCLLSEILKYSLSS